MDITFAILIGGSVALALWLTVRWVKNKATSVQQELTRLEQARSEHAEAQKKLSDRIAELEKIGARIQMVEIQVKDTQAQVDAFLEKVPDITPLEEVKAQLEKAQRAFQTDMDSRLRTAKRVLANEFDVRTQQAKDGVEDEVRRIAKSTIPPAPLPRNTEWEEGIEEKISQLVAYLWLVNRALVSPLIDPIRQDISMFEKRERQAARNHEVAKKWLQQAKARLDETPDTNQEKATQEFEAAQQECQRTKDNLSSIRREKKGPHMAELRERFSRLNKLEISLRELDN